MSEPTYRINTERTAGAGHNPWEARVVRLSDGEHVLSAWGDSEAAVLADAQTFANSQTDTPALGGVYFMTEDGELTPPVPESQSLRA